MRVRDAHAGDAPELAALVQHHPVFAAYGMRPSTLAAALIQAIGRGDRVVTAVAPSGGRLGLAWWLPRGAFGRSAYLRLLVVSAHATGGGVGAALMDAVEVEAFAGSDDLFALANVDNDGARRFYARRGYAEVGRLDDYVAPGLHEVLLRKRRPQAPTTG